MWCGVCVCGVVGVYGVGCVWCGVVGVVCMLKGWSDGTVGKKDHSSEADYKGP